MRSIIIALIILPLVSFARDSLNVTQVGQFVSCWYETSEIEVHDNFAYVATGRSGLHIVDISTLGQPVETGICHTRGTTRDVALQGNYAFLADGPQGLRVVDISNSQNPTMVAESNPENSDFRRIAVTATHAFVTNPTSGIQIFDITNPLAPLPLPLYAVAEPQDIVIAGQYAYVVTATGFEILDISTPANPELLGSLTGFDDGWRIVLEGTLAYISCQSDPLRVVDVTNPELPVVIGTAYVAFDAYDIAISGHILYVASSANVTAIDLSDLEHPEEVASYSNNGSISVVAVSGDVLLASDRNIDFLVFDIAVPTELELVGSMVRPEELWNVALSGNYAYVAGPTQALQVFDVSTPAQPALLATTRYDGTANDVFVSGSRLYLAETYGGNHSGLRVFDITDPSSPTELGFGETFDFANGVAVNGNYAYIASAGALVVLDMSNPAAPVVVEELSSFAGALNVVVSGQYAYVADFDDLRILDVSNPAQPLHHGSYDSPGYVYDVVVSGTIAFLAESWGVRTVDVSNPAAPVSIGQFSTPDEATEISLIGNAAYVATGEHGLRIIDITEPTNLQEVGYYVEDFNTRSLSAHGDYVYAAEAYAFSVYDASVALSLVNDLNTGDQSSLVTTFSLHPVYPNPFNATAQIRFDVPSTSFVNVAVYDLQGRLVEQLASRMFEAGTHGIAYDAIKNASGMYIVRMSSDAFSETQKIVLLK